MTTEEKLDETDIRILKLLQQNSRLTVKELAARVHLSPSPTFERQKRLEREGYIQRYGAIVDHHKLGHNVIVLCNIRLKQHTHDLIQQFMDTVQAIDQITECYNTTGDYDFQIKVYARDESKKYIDDIPVYFRTFLPPIQGTAAWRNHQFSNHQKTGREAFLLHLHYS